MKKNLTESFVAINSFGKFLKHLLFISLVLLSLSSCVNFRSGVHPKLVKNVKTLATKTEVDLTKNDTLTAFVTSEIAIEAKRSEVIPSPVIANAFVASKNHFMDLKPDVLENTAGNSSSKSKIKTNRKKLNASTPFNKEETDEELDIRQSDFAFLFGILAIVSFFSIFLSPLIFIFCPLAYYNGKRVLKRGDAQRGSKEYRRAQFGASIGAAFYIGWAVFFSIVLIIIVAGYN